MIKIQSTTNTYGLHAAQKRSHRNISSTASTTWSLSKPSHSGRQDFDEDENRGCEEVEDKTSSEPTTFINCIRPHGTEVLPGRVQTCPGYVACHRAQPRRLINTSVSLVEAKFVLQNNFIFSQHAFK